MKSTWEPLARTVVGAFAGLFIALVIQQAEDLAHESGMPGRPASLHLPLVP